MIEVRRLEVSELDRLGEIDRSEKITQQYVQSNGNLELIDVDIDADRWGGERARPVEFYAETCRKLAAHGATLLGAFDDEHLAGIAVYEPSLEGRSQTANFALLHVSRQYRRTGAGRMLATAVFALATDDGAERIYVSATPTRGTVDFYMAQGFEPLAEPDPRMLALEPDDIHLERRLP